MDVTPSDDYPSLMNLDVFASSLMNTATNLAGVIEDWAQLDETLASHYTDDLVRVAAGVSSA